jgi:hypothetical protein
MNMTSEVIGWLHHAEQVQVLVRGENGRVSRQTADADDSFGHQAIQTGTFRRGTPIYDPVTRELVAYEMERLPNGTLA